MIFIIDEKDSEGKKFEHYVLSGGPALSYSANSWWAALSVLPQIKDLKGGGKELEEHEKIEARLLLGFHI